MCPIVHTNILTTCLAGVFSSTLDWFLCLQPLLPQAIVFFYSKPGKEQAVFLFFLPIFCFNKDFMEQFCPANRRFYTAKFKLQPLKEFDAPFLFCNAIDCHLSLITISF